MVKRKSIDATSSATQGPDHSSSSLPSPGCDYEVFLSFRGPDTRKTFTDHLYYALVSRGIRTFRDNEELPIGEEIDRALRHAIHESKIAIPIFSEGYASSKWCLRELAEIVECMKQKGRRQMTVKPVFYHVTPSDVRYQNGSYEEAFRNHEQRYGQETEGWKKALKEVADLKGWDLENVADGHEAKLIQLIVKEVWSELRKSPLIVSDNLVGIQFHVEEVIKLLIIGSNDVRIVGIHGLGGIGKTTIARSVYNAIYHHFDGCSFIADARETIQRRGLVHLQNQLIMNILNLENPNFLDVDQGIHMVKERFSNKKVLIVLDDVDTCDALNVTIRNRDWFGYGSKIIITTRARHILNDYGVDGTYEPKEMDLDQSLELFSKHAFEMNQPPKHYLALSIDVVKTTGGLPLALEVIGSSLFGKGESDWKFKVDKLKKVPSSEVQKKLKISYDDLENEQQQMFLDIACFFIGMNKNIACYIWNGFNFFAREGIDVLHQKSLVKFGKNDELMMHDQLRDLGREIVRQENCKELGERSRLWSHEALKVLRTKMGTRKVEGVSFSGQYGQSLLEGFAAMTNLKLLQLDYAVVSGNFMHSFSELRWLSLKGCPDIPLTPTNPSELAVLDLSYSGITESWMGWSYIKVAEFLKVLDLSCSDKLSQTPNLSANIQLEVLILELCVNLATIDASICHLKSLVVLNMKRCPSLINLPTGICKLRSLERLDISYTRISQLPEKLGSLVALRELLIDGTSIQWLPKSIGYLRNLKTLSAGGCNIQEGGIPDVIGRLSSLEFLSLNGNQFCSLPETVSSLSLLQTLSLAGCHKLRSLPGLPSSLKSLDASRCALKSLPRLSNLTNLEVLCLYYCENLVELPITINAFTRLKSLQLKECPALRYIRHLPSDLTDLIVDRCENLREISAFLGMRNLVSLRLDACYSLAKIESLEGLDSLQKLEISYCYSLRKLPKLQDSKELRSLNFFKVGLSEIEGLGGLYVLKELIVEWCLLLKKIPSLSDSENLVRIIINSCFELSEIEGLEGLDSLEQLDLIQCRSLTKVQLPKKLRELNISSCEKLFEIEGLEDLESLKNLQIRGCECVERLPDLSNLNKLNYLVVEDCGKLIEIPSVGRLESLEVLQVMRSCKDVLPDLSNLTKLRKLWITDCEKLTEIQGVDRLEMLEDLCIDGCISVETLPCLSNLTKLNTLSAVNCRMLKDILGVLKLESFRGLNIRGP